MEPTYRVVIVMQIFSELRVAIEVFECSQKKPFTSISRITLSLGASRRLRELNSRNQANNMSRRKQNVNAFIYLQIYHNSTVIEKYFSHDCRNGND